MHAENAGLIVMISEETDSHLEKAGSLLNITLCKAVISLYNQRNPRVYSCAVIACCRTID